MEKNLGHATAYGYAKSKGYSGTEEEFAELMADYASVGQSAAQSAEQAAASATSASGSATTASQAAQTATSKASEAVTAAGTATTKASEANQSASTASAAATSASTSAQTATTAAATATTKADEAEASATTASTAKTDAESARDAAAQSASEAAESAESIDPDEFDRKIYAAFATDIATGAIASFPDGADSIPMKDVLVHIEPVQAGSGDPSPENVRPITGWTGAKVMRTGKNLWSFNDSYSVSGYTVVLDRVPFSLYPGTYTFSAVPNMEADSVALFGYHEDGTRTEIGRLDASTTRSSSTATVSKPVVSLYFVTNKSGTISNIQLELGSTATKYEPYSGQTYDITFPSEAGTVYGGTLDVTSGVLTVDRAMVDLGTLSWNERAEGSKEWIARTPDNSIAPATAGDNSAITSVYVNSKKIGLPADGQFILNSKSISSSLRIICIKDSRYTDVGTFKTAMSGIPLVYELATPITYQLTPQEITSLLGVNSVWADTGDIEVEYRADTKLYTTKKITDAVNALS